MKKHFLALLTCLMALALVHAQAPSAETLLSAARQQAAKENKKVFVIFHASWCGWCRKMDSSLADPSVKPYFDKNYVTVHLTIMESDDKKGLENPGAQEIYMSRGGGEHTGIPFWMVYDKDGNIIADSQMSPGVNTGCPATPEEVHYFLAVLRRTSTISPEQAAAVEKRFRKNDL